MVDIGFLIGSTVCAYGITQYIYDKERLFRKRLEMAMDRAGLYIKIETKSREKKYDRPRCLEFYKMHYGWFAKYVLPVGVTIDDVDKARRILEGATTSEIVPWTEGQILSMEIYNHRIKSKVNYNESILQEVMKYPLAISPGYGRRGIEILNYYELPNPHMLIAGMAGMGKSNALNVIAVELLENENVQLYIADPKRVEFTSYSGIPRVKAVAKEPLEIHQMLQDIVTIQGKRERFLEQEGYKNIITFNNHHKEKLPYTFVILDEYADFPSDDERFWDKVTTIARKGRSSGIYLIMSTQRPSADVLPPNVKSNLGIKIALKVSTLSNSRIVIESDRAYKLPLIAGRAILDVGVQREIQIPYISDRQLEKLLQKHRVIPDDERDSETL